jgi:hypothetical protein
VKAIFSSTYTPQYAFFIPFAAYSWEKLGVESICFIPQEPNDLHFDVGMMLAQQFSPATKFFKFNSPNHKQATYAQLVRLFAGTLPNIPEEEPLIISDVDMAVFSQELISPFPEFGIHAWGTDLVPEGQLAMCYVSMPKWKWRQVMNTDNKTYQEMLDEHLGHIECDHFRGNYWAYDQEQLSNHVSKYDYISHPRAIPGTQFASNRADRDDAFWFNKVGPHLFDAHLWRPGHEESNFQKILRLFSEMYPTDDLTWMREYRDKFIHTL